MSRSAKLALFNFLVALVCGTAFAVNLALFSSHPADMSEFGWTLTISNGGLALINFGCAAIHTLRAVNQREK